MKKNRYFLLLLFPILTSCPMIDYFPEYTGVNVIGDGNSLTLMNSTHWERVLIDTTFPNAHTIFETVTGQTGPTPGSSVLRLEALNQLQNGDFHDGSDGWLNTNGITTLTYQTLPPTRLDFTRPTPQDFLYNELDDKLLSYKNEGNYQVRLLFSSNTSTSWNMTFVVGINSRINNTGYLNNSNVLMTIQENFSEPTGFTTIIRNLEIPQSNPNTEFLLSSRSLTLLDTQNAFMVIPSPVIDTTLHWVQILENNPDLYSIETRLPKLPRIDRQDLPLRGGGTFTVKLWVKSDDPAGNRFIPTELAVELVGYKKNTATGELTINKSQIGSIELPQSITDDWTEVSINIKGPLQDADLNGLTSDEAAMGIRMYPFDPYSENSNDTTIKSASVLLSNLQLFWSPR